MTHHYQVWGSIQRKKNAFFIHISERQRTGFGPIAFHMSSYLKITIRWPVCSYSMRRETSLSLFEGGWEKVSFIYQWNWPALRNETLLWFISAEWAFIISRFSDTIYFTHGLTHYRNFLSCWNDPSATSLYFEPVNAPGIFIPSDTYKAESAFLRLRAVSLFPKCDIELESFSNSPGFTGMEEWNQSGPFR